MISDEPWLEFVEHVAETLDIGPGARVFQVNCGAGAFLFPLSVNGYIVGGQDPSEPLIAKAREAMPSGRWSVGEASALDPGESWDVVLACEAFEKFPDLNYARGIIARMAAKASHAIAILQLTDAFDRSWMLQTLNEVGVQAVEFEQTGDRYHVFARV